MRAQHCLSIFFALVREIRGRASSRIRRGLIESSPSPPASRSPSSSACLSVYMYLFLIPSVFIFVYFSSACCFPSAAYRFLYTSLAASALSLYSFQINERQSLFLLLQRFGKSILFPLLIKNAESNCRDTRKQRGSMVYIFVRRDSCPRWEINKIELSWIIVHPVLLQERL